MNMQELKKLIYQGKKVDIECKKAEKSVPKSAYESYSAFANTKGGYIILGVAIYLSRYLESIVYNGSSLALFVEESNDFDELIYCFDRLIRRKDDR